MSVVDKSSAGVGVRQFHIDVAPGEVSTVALLPGDPFRVPLVGSPCSREAGPLVTSTGFVASSRMTAREGGT